MSRKKRNTNKSVKIIYEIYGVLTISFALLLFLSLYFNSAGVLGYLLNNLFKGLFGLASYIIPIFIFVVGVGLIVKQDRLNFKLKFYAMCSLFIFFVIFIEISKSGNMGNISFVDRISNSFYMGKNGSGGGAAGELLSYPLVKLLGSTGAYLFTCTFIIINLLLLTNASIYGISKNIKNSIHNFFRKAADAVRSDKKTKKSISSDIIIPVDTKEPQVMLDKQEDNKKKYIDEINKKIKILDFFKSSELDNANNQDSSFMNVDSPAVNPIKEDSPPVMHEYIDVKKEKARNKEKDKVVNGSDIEEEILSQEKQKPAQYIFPPIDLLNTPSSPKSGGDKRELISNAKLLEETLESFGVVAKVVQVSRGPVITRYELQPSPGVKVSKIVNLSDDIALNLAAPSVRIEAPIPGKAAVGIEIPNKDVSSVLLREVIESKEFIEHNSSLTFALGKDVAGNSIVADLSKMPHLLIAGATGSGKSVCVNALITSILYKSSPDEVRLVMVDPKVVELSTYNGIPHLLIPVVTDPRKAAGALNWAVQEMTNRYKLFADNNVRNIESFNGLMSDKNPSAVLPKIVVIIDELADLMMVAPNDVEDCICRLAQMARAAGMHLVVATQRPSVDVITGVIKANIPSRISFAVSSQIDSRTILDMSGAEKLLGKGDMLYYPIGESKPVRVQGAFVSEKEVEQIVEFVKKQSGSEYKEEIMDEIEGKTGSVSDDEADEVLPEAIRVVAETGQASISLLQRRLRIGYNRAARLIDSMEERGIIGSYEGSKPRQVLITPEELDNTK